MILIYLFILAIFFTIIGFVLVLVVGNLYARWSENREHKRMVAEYEKRRAEATAGMTEDEKASWDLQESLRYQESLDRY